MLDTSGRFLRRVFAGGDTCGLSRASVARFSPSRFIVAGFLSGLTDTAPRCGIPVSLGWVSVFNSPSRATDFLGIEYPLHVVSHGGNLCPGFFVFGFCHALPRNSCLGIGEHIERYLPALTGHAAPARGRLLL